MKQGDLCAAIRRTPLFLHELKTLKIGQYAQSFIEIDEILIYLCTAAGDEIQVLCANNSIGFVSPECVRAL
jgi:hypothetical protein